MRTVNPALRRRAANAPKRLPTRTEPSNVGGGLLPIAVFQAQMQ
ncbi:hypothetical protein C4J85_2321 [Pseudomonas sp. R4-34-07]|nr:hypothetical protein C4J85_2321 [Pseudomonas sp. R4-34-07]